MKIFGSPREQLRKVTNGRFEIESDGDTAYLEYAYDGSVLELIHTEVPPKLRGRNLASELAQAAFKWARERKAKVDIICPFVAQYIKRHTEYSDLLFK